MDFSYWGRSSDWIEHPPVTRKVAGSSPVGPASASLKLGYGGTKPALESESGHNTTRQICLYITIYNIDMYFVYILLTVNKRTSIGCTNNIEDRIKRHNKGYIPATKNLLPIKLITYFAFSNKYTAYNFEKYLKSGSGRALIKKHELAKI